MKIILLKLTPHIKTNFVCAFVDIEIVDMKLKIKGFKISLYKGKISVHLPMIRKENEKIMYSPIIFLDEVFLKDLKENILKTISETYPMAEWVNGVFSRNLAIK